MGGYAYEPERWDKEAAVLWTAGLRQEAVARAQAVLDAMDDPDADAFIQPAFYLFQLNRPAEAAVVLELGLTRFPDHPMVLLSLGSSYTRSLQHRKAIPVLEAFVALGYHDMSAYDALAHSASETGDLIRARICGTLALELKDRATADRRGTPPLDRTVDPSGKTKVIAFSLFGSGAKYLRGALHNVLSARSVYPGWTCRFYADESVDRALLDVLAQEGAEVVMDESGNNDFRWRLSRRFLVADDPEVGHFLVRDADSAVNQREKAAVDDWLASGKCFHALRDWYTHTDPMLAGLWGGVAGVFPDMKGTVERFLAKQPMSTNWDQLFLRDQVWPAIRDDILVHDRCFGGHATRPFPTPTPPGREHVGQNEFASDQVAQARLLMPYADRLPALALHSQPLNFRFRSHM